MLKTWTDAAWDDYCRWQRTDRKIFKRINQLIDDIDRNGYDGIGKPGPLKHELTGYWSRHITDEHRLVYRISGDQIVIVSCRTHYKREPVEAPSYIPTEPFRVTFSLSPAWFNFRVIDQWFFRDFSAKESCFSGSAENKSYRVPASMPKNSVSL